MARKKSRGDFGRTGSGTSQSSSSRKRRRKQQDYTGGRMAAVEAGTYRPAGSGMHGRTVAARPSRGDFGRSGSGVSQVSSGSGFVPGVTGLSERDQADARKALRGSSEARSVGEIAPELLGKSAELGSLAVPGAGVARVGVAAGRALRAARTADRASDVARVSRTVRAAERAAEKAQRIQKKSEAARRAGKGRRAGRLEGRAERQSARARVRRERAGMSRGERARDRARSVRTRSVARAQMGAHRFLAGAGSGGAAGLGVREVARRDGARGAAGAVARSAVRAPARVGSRSARAAVSPGFLPVTGAVSGEGTVSNVAQLPYQLGRAAVESPGEFSKNTVTGARDMLLGAPAAVREMVTNPRGAVNMMLEDYARRYGPLVEGDMEAFRRVAVEDGATPFGLDALAVAGGTGAVVGRAGRAGALGGRAQRALTRERPGMLVEAGGRARDNRVSRNASGVVAQRVLDRARGRATERRANRGDATARAARERGLVVPLAQRSVQKRAVAGRKARTRQVNLAEQGRTLKRAVTLLASMSRGQQAAVKWALTLGIRTPDQARREIPRRIEAIRAARDSDRPVGRLDNIPELEQVLRSADEIFTEDFGRKVDQMRRIEKRLAVGDVSRGRRDPALDVDQAAIRRESQQAEHLIGPRRASQPEPATPLDSPIPEAQRAAAARTLLRRDRRARAQAEMAERRTARRAETRARREYDPSPEGINNRRWFHGTGTRGLTRESLDGAGTNPANLFGQGVYLTTKPHTARGYAKSRGKRTGDRALYEAEVKVERVLDMEAPPDPTFLRTLERTVDQLSSVFDDDSLRNVVANAARREGATNGTIYSAFRREVGDLSAYHEIPKSELFEDFQQLAWNLREAGFDAITHRGGVRTGQGRHQALVILDPNNGRNPVTRFADRRAGGVRQAPASLPMDRVPRRTRAGDAERARSGPESMEDYRARYRAALRESGLAEPGYFPSDLSRRRRFSQSAVGGTRHSEQTKAYTGQLFREGIENTDPAVMIRGWQRNIKRRNTWNMVSDTFELNSLPWSRGRDGHGSSMSDLVRKIEAEGIDPDSVVFVNPGLLRNIAHPDQVQGTANKSRSMGNPEFGEIGEAIRDASASAVRAGGEQFTQQKGWLAVPRAVLDELESSMRVGRTGRIADLLMSKMSGYLLAFNTGWLGFQTISTAAQAAMAGVTPADWVLAQIQFYRMKRAGRATGGRHGIGNRRVIESSRQIEGNPDLDRFNAYAGISQAQDFQQPPHLGAAVQGNGLIGGAVEGYRVFREGRWGQGLRSANPIQRWFRFSQIPENANRRALAYKLLKSPEVKRMNQNLKLVDRTINRMTAHFKLDPGEAVTRALRDTKALEDMSRGLADFLGDYQTFTGAERAMLKRVVPFYSWMRFATKFALFTLPSKHPTATALTYQLGRLETDDLRDILGEGMGWALGKLFMGDPADEATGFIDMYRGNPLLSGLVEMEEPKDLMGMFPPYVPILLNQIYGKDYFSGEDLTVDGETQGRRFTDRGLGNVLETALGDYLSSFTPYRVAEEMRARGVPMSSDSLLFKQEPKQYADGDNAESVQRGRREFEEGGGALGVARRRMLPFIPMDSGPLRRTGEYINAERAREDARTREGPGAGSSSIDAAIDRALERSGSSSRIDDAINKALERAGL